MGIGKILAVGWDTDGIIVNTEPLHLEAFNKALDISGFYPVSKEIYFKDYISYDDKNFFENYLKNIGKSPSKQEIENLCTKKSVLFSLLEQEATDLFYPGVIETIKKINEYGLRQFNVTGTLRHEAVAHLKKGKIENYFEFIVASEDVKNSKPNPEPYLKALERLNEKKSINACDCIVLEDSCGGVKSAKAAGMNVVGVTNTTTPENLKNAGADLVFKEINPELFLNYIRMKSENL